MASGNVSQKVVTLKPIPVPFAGFSHQTNELSKYELPIPKPRDPIFAGGMGSAGMRLRARQAGGNRVTTSK